MEPNPRPVLGRGEGAKVGLDPFPREKRGERVERLFLKPPNPLFRHVRLSPAAPFPNSVGLYPRGQPFQRLEKLLPPRMEPPVKSEVRDPKPLHFHRGKRLEKRSTPRLEIDGGGRRSRMGRAVRVEPDPERIAGKEHAVPLHLPGQMMTDVPRSGKGTDPLERARISHPPPLQLVAGNGEHLSPQPIMRLPKGPSSGSDQPFRIGKMRRSVLVHVDDQMRILRRQMTRGPGMVEMDMGEEDVSDLKEVQPVLPEGRAQAGEGGRRPRIHEEGLRIFQGIDANRPWNPLMVQIQHPHPRKGERRDGRPRGPQGRKHGRSSRFDQRSDIGMKFRSGDPK